MKLFRSLDCIQKDFGKIGKSLDFFGGISVLIVCLWIFVVIDRMKLRRVGGG